MQMHVFKNASRRALMQMLEGHSIANPPRWLSVAAPADSRGVLRQDHAARRAYSESCTTESTYRSAPRVSRLPGPRAPTMFTTPQRISARSFCIWCTG